MWRALTDAIMVTCRDTFGEPILYQAQVGPAREMVGIFEEATNFDLIDSRAEIEGAIAFVDFRSDDVTFKPTRGDMVIVKRHGKPFKMLKVDYDGYSRHRCYLREFV